MDVNTLAKSIVDQAIGDEPIKKKNPRAAIRGISRAKAIGPKRTKEIAKKAASVRWSKEKSS